MKFSRNARIFRGELDVAPFATVFFLLILFVMLSSMVYTPGVRLELPTANDLPGLDKPGFRVAIDRNGRLYFESQLIEEGELRNRLRQAVQASAEPLTLVIYADKAATREMLTRLTLLARDAGISQGWEVTLPRPLAP
jgi:biopolymer transport protein ExbD